MEKLLRMTQEELAEHVEFVLRKQGREVFHSKGGYLYSPGEIPMMMVAHLDTVHKNPVETICKSKDGRFLMSPEGIGGDDRCGVYIALEASSRIRPSLLFTYDEEIGGLGVGKFCKDYRGLDLGVKFIIEFDKAGNDVVTYYDQDAPEFMEFVEENTEYEPTYGSYSDIVDLYEEFEVACGNFSAGYENQHTKYETIDMLGVERGIENAVKLGELSEHEDVPYFKSKTMYSGNNYAYFDSYYDDIVAAAIVIDWDSGEEYMISLPEHHSDKKSLEVLEKIMGGEQGYELEYYEIYDEVLASCDTGNFGVEDLVDLVNDYLYFGM